MTKHSCRFVRFLPDSTGQKLCAYFTLRQSHPKCREPIRDTQNPCCLDRNQIAGNRTDRQIKGPVAVLVNRHVAKLLCADRTRCRGSSAKRIEGVSILPKERWPLPAVGSARTVRRRRSSDRFQIAPQCASREASPAPKSVEPPDCVPLWFRADTHSWPCHIPTT